MGKDIRKKYFARDNGPYIGLYKRRSCTVLWGAIWKDDKRSMDEWGEIQRTCKIEWV